MNVFRRRHRELDRRIEDARADADLSRRRLAEARETVIGPLHAAGERNQFAELIRRSLIEGHGGK